MQTWRLVLEYDGTLYAGWQRQPQSVTIQQVVEEALTSLLGGESVGVMASGRTDAGVHALGQVVSFRAQAERSPDQMKRGLNALLPLQVVCLDAAHAAPRFHALADARGKHYRYVLRAGRTRSPLRLDRCWTTGHTLDIAAMRSASTALLGTHDFTSFRAAGCTANDAVRTLDRVTLTEVGDELHVDVEGRGFLRHMVRNLVGSLVDVGRGRRPAAWLGEVLAACDRQSAGRTAPPQGLFMVAVDYGDEPGA